MSAAGSTEEGFVIGTAAPEPTSGAERVRVVHLPTQISGLDIVVPYALVAEISEVMLPEGGSQLGRQDAAEVVWRGQRIVLVSLEAMFQGTVPTIGQRVRCAVLYGTNPDMALPYYAVLLSGVPRSEEWTADRLQQETRVEGELWQLTAQVDDRRVAVPDIRQLESRVDEMRLRLQREVPNLA
ncbi:hypothetical protein [Halothiobacillus sp. DCM-1]|uniref:hypothetical protein n=1 Tax=Halothiobacillus sp. DCM-1 TaxID=3112558 RepID=UPI0032554C86